MSRDDLEYRSGQSCAGHESFFASEGNVITPEPRFRAMPHKHKPHKESAAAFINLNRSRLDPAELKKRLAEREQREAADTRTEVQRWLGDPPADRSALAHKTARPR